MDGFIIKIGGDQMKNMLLYTLGLMFGIVGFKGGSSVKRLGGDA